MDSSRDINLLVKKLYLGVYSHYLVLGLLRSVLRSIQSVMKKANLSAKTRRRNVIGYLTSSAFTLNYEIQNEPELLANSLIFKLHRAKHTKLTAPIYFAELIRSIHITRH